MENQDATTVARGPQAWGGPSVAERARVEGVATLTDEDLVTLLWMGELEEEQARVRARRLLGSTPLWRLAARRLPELCQGRAVGPLQAQRLLVAMELGLRAARTPVPQGVRMGSPSDVSAVCSPRLAALVREQVLALLLDRRQRLLGVTSVSEGWTEGCVVDPREVYRPALAERASGVILVHNHPSGDPTPSASDRDLTERLRRAGDVVGVKLVDHVVVARGGFASLADEGLCG